MRLLAGWAIAFAFGAVTAGQAQTPPATKAERLRQAAFAPDYAPKSHASITGVDDFSAITDRQQFTADGRPIGWRTETARLRQTAKGSVDTLRLSLGGAGRTPADIFGDPAKAQFDADAYEIAVTRDWAPMRFDAGDYDVELTPHTGIGVASSGGQAEAGALLTLGQKLDRLRGTAVEQGERAPRQTSDDKNGQNGGDYSKAADWRPYVVIDGNLITGQNPASSASVAQALLKLLGGETAK